MLKLDDYVILKKLGMGTFASVYKVKHKINNEIFALKIIDFQQLNEKEKDNALNEIRVLSSIVSNNIIGYNDSYYDEKKKTLNILMEFANDGDLDLLLKSYKKNNANIPEKEIWNYLYQILKGLKVLHTAKIMHRDLKSANIFLKNGVVKIGDLNVSKLIKNDDPNKTLAGTPYYCSPEVFSEYPYDFKCDIWSVGCIIYELCFKSPPFRGETIEEIYDAILKGEFLPLKNYSKELNYIVSLMLKVNYNERPDVFELLNNKILLKIIKPDINDVTIINMQTTIKTQNNFGDLNNKLYNLKLKKTSSTTQADINQDKNFNSPINNNKITKTSNENKVNIEPKTIQVNNIQTNNQVFQTQNQLIYNPPKNNNQIKVIPINKDQLPQNNIPNFYKKVSNNNILPNQIKNINLERNLTPVVIPTNKQISDGFMTPFTVVNPNCYNPKIAKSPQSKISVNNQITQEVIQYAYPVKGNLYAPQQYM